MMMLLTYTGTIAFFMKSFPWLNNVYVMFILSAMLMYLVGWLAGWLAARLHAVHRKNWGRPF